MNNVSRILKPSNPKLSERVIGGIQDSLGAGLPWLTYVFGRSQRMIKVVDGKDVKFPGISLLDGSYINVMPNTEYGNYCFFTTDDSEHIDFEKNRYNIVKTKFSIVFWFDSSVIGKRNEEIKADILEVLTRQCNIKNGSFKIEKIYEQSENIYKGYSIKETSNQLLMHPYFGYRFEGVMTYQETC